MKAANFLMVISADNSTYFFILWGYRQAIWRRDSVVFLLEPKKCSEWHFGTFFVWMTFDIKYFGQVAYLDTKIEIFEGIAFIVKFPCIIWHMFFGKRYFFLVKKNFWPFFKEVFIIKVKTRFWISHRGGGRGGVAIVWSVSYYCHDLVKRGGGWGGVEVAG